MLDIKKWGYPVKQGTKLYWLKGKELVEVTFVAHIPPYVSVREALEVYQWKLEHSLNLDNWDKKTRCVVECDGCLKIVPENKLFDSLQLRNADMLDNKWIKESARLSKIVVDKEDKSGKDGVDSKGRIVSRDWVIFEAKLRCPYFKECHDCVMQKDVFCGNAYHYAKRNHIAAW